MSAPPAAVRPRRSGPELLLYIAVVAAGAVVVTVAAAQAGVDPPGRANGLALVGLGVLLVAAEYFTVRFRYGREVDALNLVEAVLAPLLFAFPAQHVVPAVAIAMTLAALPRRNAPVKAAFNVAQWSLAAAVGCAVLAAAARGGGLTGRNVTAVVVALVAVLVVNQVAFTLVLAIANRQPVRRLVRGLAPVIAPGWVGGWVVNVLIGLLYAVAYAAHPGAVVLFAVPLIVLHLAYRGFAAARTDRLRLTGLHRAAQELAAPLDPREAIEPFLRAVSGSFEARAVELVLRADGGREVHRLVGDGALSHWVEAEDVVSLEGALSALPGTARFRAGRADPLSRALGAEGWHECLAAPLLDEGRLTGALLIFDQAGLETSPAGELGVLDALAREISSAFAKGRLLARVLEERRKLSEIVGTTSDGLLTVAADGTVRSWNPALERITGLRAADVIGQADELARLSPRTITGTPVDIGAWASGVELPEDLRITAVDGSQRRLSCSYSRASDSDGEAHALVVVARDVTPEEEMEALRAQFSRLVEAEATQRLVVDHLQQTVMPARPDVDGAELGVAYLASDPTAPTGGDLYDWQVLPDGNVHIAVVDVLGHGVAATKDALAVVHTLRTVAVDGTPLDELVARADRLLGAQHPELVATVVVARFDPQTGVCRVAAGGHPPALVVDTTGEVTQLAASGGAIGWPGAGSDLVAEVVLDPGDALVLYTDGLVEARKNILDGMDALLRHTAAIAHLPAPRLADELLHRALAGAARRDDSLVLVVRRAPVSVQETSRGWRILPDVREAARVRRELVAWLRAHELSGDDAALVAAELLGNAARYARTMVRLDVRLEDGVVALEVSDDGPGRTDLDQVGLVVPSLDDDKGRGLYLVRAVSEEVSVLSTVEGSVIRSLLRPTRLAPPEPARGAATDDTAPAGC